MAQSKQVFVHLYNIKIRQNTKTIIDIWGKTGHNECLIINALL